MKKKVIWTVIAIICAVGIITGFTLPLLLNNTEEPGEIDVYWPTEEWQTAIPEDQGFDSSFFTDMYGYISDEGMGIDYLLFIRNGFIIEENYLEDSKIREEGNYTDINPLVRNSTKHNIYSVTKTVVSICMGIAIDEGFIDNTSQTMYEFLQEKWKPEYDAQKENITIEQLLTMTSGMPYDTSYGGDYIQNALDEPLEFAPGTDYVYSNIGAGLVSAIIQEATGQKTSEFARDYLFEPLGISDDEWDWDETETGVSFGGSGIFITPRAMSKIGILLLNNGTWNGTQIISSEWVQRASTPKICTTSVSSWLDPVIFDQVLIPTQMFPEREQCYGYLTWIGDDWFGATGYRGQQIIIIPEYDIVVIFTSNSYAGSGNLQYSFIINTFLLGALA